MANETNIVNLLLESPVKTESSFQVSQFEPNDHERFDQVLQSEATSSRNESRSTQPFTGTEKPASESTPAHVSRDDDSAPLPSENRPGTSHADAGNPVEEAPTHSSSNSHSNANPPDDKEPVNPFALPLDQLTEDLSPADDAPGLTQHANSSAVAALAGIVDSQGLTDEGSPAIDTLKELLAGFNIDPETINRLMAALRTGDTPAVQGIINALRGLLNASNQVAQAQAPGADIASTSLNQPEQLALNILMRAGLSVGEAQQVIQQVRAGHTPQPLTETSLQTAKTVAEAVAVKPNSENFNGSGTLQNSTGDANGSAKHSSEAPRNFTGLAGERLETLASLVSPDKSSNPGNAQTNPLINQATGSPQLNLAQTGGQPAPGILAEGAPGQAPAALAETAAKGVDFVKPAITETYNGRASMDKPITAQIIEKFSLRGFGNQREVHIKLDPPSLGTVRMNVSTSGESVRATIIAENNIVKSIIESNLSQLKDAITHQGVKIDSFNVLVGGNASHSAQGHKDALEFFSQLGREGSMAHEQVEEVVTLHRPVFLYENQSISIFA